MLKSILQLDNGKFSDAEPYFCAVISHASPSLAENAVYDIDDKNRLLAISEPFAVRGKMVGKLTGSKDTYSHA